MMQSAYLCVILLDLKHKKIAISCGFNPISNSS